ncbi:LANO_0A01706g1_1 [Lachancea nothofagi CBS 11611]|uniref:Postreplication repair E3 ubiquitin-protein ligase RAD18 n=1 Tax=Lachancea nothofagi CBS 11611 TaxID=1266666 RepID=A0A1G4IMR2_9SACH|nr:LANO_0A01706g1_1 [Lachancea nothofagi CBS 11611]
MPRKAKLEEQISSVTDPRDFLRTQIPELSDVDTLLRCHICKGFLKTPVLTPCGHTFCSLCIREYLNRELKCPLCLAELRESMLKSEFMVSELVTSYASLRAKLLEFLDSSKNSRTVALTSDTSVIEIPEHHTKISNDDTNDDDDIQIIETRESRPSKRTSDLVLMSHKKSRKDSSKSGITSLFSKTKSPPSQQDLANCPICGKSYHVEHLQRIHLDECLTLGALDQPEPANSSSIAEKAPPTPEKSSAVVEPIAKRSIKPSVNVETTHYNRYIESAQKKNVTRLAKLNFSSMSLQQLKNKLSSLKLPTIGTRQQMMNRYNHYEMLWNSNFIDSINSVDERELRRRLASWEASHNGSEPIQRTSAISKFLNKNPTSVMEGFKTDRFDRKGWMRSHQKVFRRLMKEAKEGLKRSRKSRPENVSADEAKETYDSSLQHNESISSETNAVPSNQLLTKADTFATSSQSSTAL